MKIEFFSEADNHNADMTSTWTAVLAVQKALPCFTYLFFSFWSISQQGLLV